MIRALLLDLDDTLLDEQSASRAGWEALVAAFSGAPGQVLELTLDRWREVSRTHWRRYEAGQWTFQEQRRARVRDFLGKNLDDDQADLIWDVYRTSYEAAWRLVPHAKAFLDRTSGHPRAVVTNGDRTQQHFKLSRTGLAAYLPLVVTPADAGAWKPDPKIFLHAFQHLENQVPGLRFEEVLLVGDDSVRDIEPARSLGMETFQVVPEDPSRGLLAALECFSLTGH